MVLPVYPNNAAVRQTKVISLSAFRTGSQSLQEALRILGYRDVFHSCTLTGDMPDIVAGWSALGQAADANISCIPSYTGQAYSRDDWDAMFGPCEALTDVTPFAESLVSAYPDAKFILVHRDFESWSKSFLETLVYPSYSLAGWFSGTFMEGLIGLPVSQTAWKLFMGHLGICNMAKAKDRRILKTGYERHYERMQKIVPSEQLLMLTLGDGWGPLCKFLGKPVPDEPFPKLNESRVFRENYYKLHRRAIPAGLLKLSLPFFLAAGSLRLAPLIMQSDYAKGMNEQLVRVIIASGVILTGLWWALRVPLL